MRRLCGSAMIRWLQALQKANKETLDRKQYFDVLIVNYLFVYNSFKFVLSHITQNEKS